MARYSQKKPEKQKNKTKKTTWPDQMNLSGLRLIQVSLQWQRGEGTAGQGGGEGHHNFGSIVLDDHWSKKIYRPKMIVWSGAIIHP